jgi:hypothetical protein
MHLIHFKQGNKKVVLFFPTQPTAIVVSDSGTKAASLFSSRNRGFTVLYGSYINVSAALSLLNIVYNSIYYSTLIFTN